MTDIKKSELNSQTQKTDLEQQLALLQRQADEYLDGWKRARADYQNYKKETEKRNTELIQFANASLVAELLPIYNHFKLALAHIPEAQKKVEWVVGFEYIYRQLTDFLKNLGIEEIKTVSEKFNPDIHEAVAHEVKDGFASDVIFEEVSPGYTLHGSVVVPAKVKVAK